MNATTARNKRLAALAAHAAASGRLGPSDLRQIQRDLLADGIESRRQAEILIALDRAVPQAEGDFSEYLIDAMAAFLVWGERPTGRVMPEAAEWLVACLGEGGMTRTGLAILAEIAAEAQEIPPCLLAPLQDAGCRALLAA